jgi:hypothetical protein
MHVIRGLVLPKSQLNFGRRLNKLKVLGEKGGLFHSEPMRCAPPLLMNFYVIITITTYLSAYFRCNFTKSGLV